MLDAYDLKSFNAASEPGTCIARAGVQLRFLTLLRSHQKVAWHFAPASALPRVGQELLTAKPARRGPHFH